MLSQQFSNSYQRYYLIWRRHENMSLCTGSWVHSNNVRIASRVGAQFRTRASESQKHLPLPTVVSSVLTTRPWPTHPSKRNGTSWTVSPIARNSESILSRNDSPLNCLHLALAYKYKCGCNVKSAIFKLISKIDKNLECFLWNCPKVNATNLTHDS